VSVFKFDARARLSVELALTAGGCNPSREQWQESEARSLGMSGAEIDVARQGRGFDVTVSSAIALALTDGADLDSARARAVKSGISQAVCSEIELFAAGLRATPEVGKSYV
jgi:hypothetical protein